MEAEESQTCPRRMGEGGPWPHEENKDRWMPGHGLAGQDAAGLSCSFCGSLHPDRFMELVREGWVVGPTDKNYKAYLGKPVTAEDREQRRAEWVDHMSPLGNEDRAALAEMWEREHEHPMSSTEAKFYYQHLSPDQQREFIELYNGKQMKVGEPGHFYVWPFFCGPAAEAGS